MNANPWDWCRCGHVFLLHDVEDFDGTNPTCCVEGCGGPCAAGQYPGPVLPATAPDGSAAASG